MRVHNTPVRPRGCFFRRLTRESTIDLSLSLSPYTHIYIPPVRTCTCMYTRECVQSKTCRLLFPQTVWKLENQSTDRDTGGRLRRARRGNKTLCVFVNNPFLDRICKRFRVTGNTATRRHAGVVNNVYCIARNTVSY